MNRIVRLCLLVAAALLAPVVPFVLWGDRIETAVDAWLRSGPEDAAVGWATIAVLATDVLLPVPSSLVNTWAGAQLGIVHGTLCAWSGLTIGGVAGFALSRWLGPPLVDRLVAPADRRHLQALAQRQGWLLVIATRPMPLLAEATVLLLGSMRLGWNSFLPGLLLSNFGLALAYAALGATARSSGRLGLVLLCSIVLPVAATLVVRSMLARTSAEGQRPTDRN